MESNGSDILFFVVQCQTQYSTVVFLDWLRGSSKRVGAFIDKLNNLSIHRPLG